VGLAPVAAGTNERLDTFHEAFDVVVLIVHAATSGRPTAARRPLMSGKTWLGCLPVTCVFACSNAKANARFDENRYISVKNENT
jgi:hypothetical protein